MPRLHGVSVRSALVTAVRLTVPPSCASVVFAASSTDSHVGDTVLEAASAMDAGALEPRRAMYAVISCAPPAGSLSIVLQVVPVLQNVNVLPVVASQNTSARPIALTSTDADAVSFKGLPTPTAAGTSVLMVTPSPDGPERGDDVSPDPFSGFVSERDFAGTLGDTGGRPGEAAAGADTSHAAPGPEKGHSWLPGGTLSAGASSPAPFGSDGPRVAGARARLLAGGAAARPMTLTCRNAATRTSGRYPVRKHSRRRPIRRGKFRNPSSVTSPQAARAATRPCRGLAHGSCLRAGGIPSR